MTYTYKRNGGRASGMAARRAMDGVKRKEARFVWVFAGAVAVMICALLVWIAVRISGSTQVVRSAEAQFPRNTVDMHGTYSGKADVLPPPRG